MSSSVAVRIDFRVRSVGVYNVYRQEALLVNQHLELQKHSFIFFFWFPFLVALMLSSFVCCIVRRKG